MFRASRFPGRQLALLIPCLIVLSMLLAACGGSDDSDDDMALDEDARTSSGEAVEPASEESSDYFAASSGSVAEPPADGQSGQLSLDRLVIRTSQITLAVDDTPGATASVRNLATSKNGFVFASSTYIEDDRQYAQLTLRVPSDRFDETIADLRSAPYVSEVVREESSSQDVSAEYVDNESRLTALEETQRRYLALLSEAETVDEILRLESELTNVRSQIETIKGRQNYLDEMTSFSTITVHLRPADVEEEDPDDDLTLARIFESAWERSTGALAGVAEAVVVVAIFALFFAPLTFLSYILFRLARRLTARVAE